MNVFKFGGASIKDVAAIKNVGQIIKQYQTQPLLVVVSALGKTTNALEEVLEAYYHQNTALLQEKLQLVKQKHFEILAALFDETEAIFDEINDIFVDLEWILEEVPDNTFGYLYDQIVSHGEILSTQIVAAYLNKIGIKTTWLDVRDCILTDNTYREAEVDWVTTNQNIQETVPRLLEQGVVLTQGFLGGTSENFTTTLGREGSDYTAAIFSYCLDAESMSIWKDVPGVLTGDPRLFDHMTKLETLSYGEAIEMTYYGAQVIHPKTIRPLQNKQIPLKVKSFVDPAGSGTTIQQTTEAIDYPPMIVVKNNQTLLKITSKDFYFVDESKFSKLFQLFASHRIKVNMTQNTALAFSVCVNANPEQIKHLTIAIDQDYILETIEDLKLVTLRYPNQETIDRFDNGRKIYLEEKIRNTVQLVIDSQEVL